jgi:hypothetical protein
MNRLARILEGEMEKLAARQEGRDENNQLREWNRKLQEELIRMEHEFCLELEAVSLQDDEEEQCRE